MELLLKLADVIDEQRRRADAARVAERRQADVDRRRRDAVLRRQPALLRRRRPHARGQGGGRVRRGLHLDHPPRAARDRRRDHALELPADDGGLEDRARARRRQRPDPQAGRADAADDAALRRAGAGVPAAGRAPGDHRRRRPRRRGARPPRRHQADLADRLRRDRQADRRRRGAEQPQARAPRARRQGADGRARRRRPGHGRRGDQDRRLLELGPGLHRVLAHPRPREGLRRRHVRDGQDARGDEGRRPGRRRGRRHGPGDLARAAGARARLPRARRRREGDGRHRRRGDRRPRLLRQADRRRGRRAGLGDRPERGLRAGGDRAALRLRRRGDRDGERRPLRARRLRLLAGRRPGDVRRPQARVRHRLGERAPLPARLRDAARRLQGVRLRQGHVALLDGGVHAHQARRGEAVLTVELSDAAPASTGPARRRWRRASSSASPRSNPRSRELFERAGASLLGGVPMSWMAKWAGRLSALPRRGDGARVVDVDGHEYVDLCLGDTGAMAGHAPRADRRAPSPRRRRAASRRCCRARTRSGPAEELRRRFGLPRLAVHALARPTRTASRSGSRARSPGGRRSSSSTTATTAPSTRRSRLCAATASVASGGQRRPAGRPGADDEGRRAGTTLERSSAALAPGDVACVLAEPALTNIGIVLPEPGFHDALRELTRADRDAARSSTRRTPSAPAPAAAPPPGARARSAHDRKGDRRRRPRRRLRRLRGGRGADRSRREDADYEDVGGDRRHARRQRALARRRACDAWRGADRGGVRADDPARRPVRRGGRGRDRGRRAAVARDPSWAAAPSTASRRTRRGTAPSRPPPATTSWSASCTSTRSTAAS